MRFMIMHKMTAEMEQGLPPEPEIIAGVNQLITESLKEQAFLSGEGLKPTAQRTRLLYQGGARISAQDGPFPDTGELVGGYSLLKVRSREETLAACDRLGAAAGEAQIILGPVVEPWDLGMIPEPKHAPLRFLALAQISAAAEAEQPPDAAAAAREQAALDALKRDGVLQASGKLASTRRGARIRKQGSRHTVIDGPFTESKELVAGYAILQLPSREAAIEWSKRFLDVVRVEEVDVRLLAEAAPPRQVG